MSLGVTLHPLFARSARSAKGCFVYEVRVNSAADRSYSLTETAELLGVSYRTVLRYLKYHNGKLSGYKIAVTPRRHEWRIPRTAIEEFLRND